MFRLKLQKQELCNLFTQIDCAIAREFILAAARKSATRRKKHNPSIHLIYSRTLNGINHSFGGVKE